MPAAHDPAPDEFLCSLLWPDLFRKMNVGSTSVDATVNGLRSSLCVLC
jgi:hypothetical protein